MSNPASNSTRTEPNSHPLGKSITSTKDTEIPHSREPTVSPTGSDHLMMMETSLTDSSDPNQLNPRELENNKDHLTDYTFSLPPPPRRKSGILITEPIDNDASITLPSQVFVKTHARTNTFGRPLLEGLLGDVRNRRTSPSLLASSDLSSQDRQESNEK